VEPCFREFPGCGLPKSHNLLTGFMVLSIGFHSSTFFAYHDLATSSLLQHLRDCGGGIPTSTKGEDKIHSEMHILLYAPFTHLAIP
jgi:hypothetical protein